MRKEEGERIREVKKTMLRIRVQLNFISDSESYWYYKRKTGKFLNLHPELK
jgi:hypothetical protein